MCFVRLRGTSEFFESEDNVLQGFDVCDLAQRWSLQLCQYSLDTEFLLAINRRKTGVHLVECSPDFCFLDIVKSQAFEEHRTVFSN